MPNNDKNFLRMAAHHPLAALQEAYDDPSLARAVNSKEWDALMLAADSGDAEKVRWLSTICDPKRATSKGETALTIAARRGALACVEVLAPLSNLSTRGPRWHTPLQAAAVKKNEDCALAIIKLMDNASLKYEFDQGSANVCLELSGTQAFECFEQAGLVDSELLSQAFVTFCGRGMIEEAAKRYAKVSTPELKIAALETASYYSFEEGRDQKIDAYLMAELDRFKPEQANEAWQTLFINSFKSAPPELIESLASKVRGELSQQAPLDAIRAAFTRLDPTVIKIAATRFDKDAIDRGFIETLFYADDRGVDTTHAGQTWLVELFKVGVGIVDFKSCQVLDYSTPGCGKSVATYLADAGYASSLRVALTYCDPNGFDQLGYTPLMRAAEKGHSDCVKALLEVCDPLATRRELDLTRRGSRHVARDAEDYALESGHASIALEIRAAKKNKLREIMDTEARADALMGK